MSDAMRSMTRGVRSGGARRARWGLIDQVVSSLTNFAVTAVVAHQTTPAEFGAFSVALVVYICLLWVARSLVGEPFAVRLTAAAQSAKSSAARQASGAALVVGTVAALVIVVTGMTLGSATGRVLITIGIFMPALLIQDCYRYLLISDGRARDAAFNDGAWLVVQSGLVVGLLLAGSAGPVSLTVAFGIGAAVAAVLGACQTAVLPSPSACRKWLRSQRDLIVPFVIELLVVSAAPQLSMVGVAAFGGVVAVGEVRAAIFLLSPPTVLFSGLVLFAVPEAVRLRERSLSALRNLVVVLAGVMMTLTAGWVIVLELIPEHLGTVLLRSNWATGHHLLLPVGAFTAFTACMWAALVGLRSLEATGRSMRLRVWVGPATVLSCVVGTQIGGSEGTAIGLAGSAIFSAVLTWLAFRHALAAHDPTLASARSS